MKTGVIIIFLALSYNVLGQQFGASTYEFMSPTTTREVLIDKSKKPGTGAGKTKKVKRYSVKDEEPGAWRVIKSAGLYGGGELNGLVSGGGDSAGGGAINGTLGLNLYTSRILCNLSFSYNPRQEVEMKSLDNFAVSLINPNLNGHSLSLDLLYKIHPHWGVSTKFVLADNLWKLDSSVVDASPTIFKLGFYYKLFDFTDNDNNILFLLEALYTYRGVAGDFNNEKHMIDGYQVSQRGYNGFELGGNIYLNELQMYVRYSVNPQGNRDFLLPGFSGNQVVIGLNVAGEIIPLKKSNPETQLKQSSFPFP